MKEINKYLNGHIDQFITYDDIVSLFDLTKFDENEIINIFNALIEHNSLVITRLKTNHTVKTKPISFVVGSSNQKIKSNDSSEIVFSGTVVSAASLIMELDDFNDVLKTLLQEKDANNIFRLLILYLIREKNSLLEYESDTEAKSMIDTINNKINSIREFVMQNKIQCKQILCSTNAKQLSCLYDMLGNNMTVDEIRLLSKAFYPQIKRLLTQLISSKNNITTITIPNCEYQINKISSEDVLIYYIVDSSRVVILLITDSQSLSVINELSIRTRLYYAQIRKNNTRNICEDAAYLLDILASAKTLEV